MVFDDRKNLAIGFVLTAPSPATSGTSLVLVSGQGARFSGTPPYNATVGPPNTILTTANSEIVRVTAKSTDTFTITRTQEGTSARAIVAGDLFYAGPTDKTFDDIETELAADTALLADGFPLGVGAWTTYTPTLTQSGAVTKTVQQARYTQIGKLIVGELYLTVTGTGTASNAILVGLPVACAQTTAPLGSGFIFDSSAASAQVGHWLCASSTSVMHLLLHGGNGQGAGATASGFTAALASGDQVRAQFSYEIA